MTPSRAELDALVHATAILDHYDLAVSTGRQAYAAATRDRLAESRNTARVVVLARTGDARLSRENDEALKRAADGWWAGRRAKGAGVDW